MLLAFPGSLDGRVAVADRVHGTSSLGVGTEARFGKHFNMIAKPPSFCGACALQWLTLTQKRPLGLLKRRNCCKSASTGD